MGAGGAETGGVEAAGVETGGAEGVSSALPEAFCVYQAGGA
ncbi:hypothetical protein [Streptomyces sp. DSM 118878]